MPIMTVADLHGGILNQLYYGTNHYFEFDNVNMRICEENGVVIGSINNGIKIWKP
jgi:hypothetical protein